MKTNPTERKLSLLLSYLIGGLLVLLPFHALLTTWVGSNAGHLDLIKIWKEIVIIVIAFPSGWLFFKSTSLKSWAKKSFLFKLIGLYFLISLVLGVWGIAHHEIIASALIYGLIINLRFLGFFIICVVVSSYSDWLRTRWPKLILWPSFFVVVFGITQKFFLPTDFLKHFGYSPGTIPAYQTVDSNVDYARIQSTMRGANPLGAYLLLVIPATILVIRRALPFLGVALLALITVLFFTYSRSAWIGLALSLLVLGVLWKAKSIGMFYLIGSSLILLLAVTLFIFRSNPNVQNLLFHTSSRSASAYSSNEIRDTALKQGLNDVVNQPFGEGPGTAGPASYRNQGHSARIAEDYYLQIGQEVGILGLLIFLLINGVLAYNLFLVRTDVLAQLLLVSLVGISFVNLLSHAWTDDTLSLLWWGLAGICLGSLHIIAPKPSGKITKT